MANVLVTGHSGWIGRVVSDHLSQIHDVYGVSRSAGHHRQLKKVMMADITSPYTKINIHQTYPKCDVIVHCAASLENSSNASIVNCYGTHQMLDLATLWDAQFIYLSSIGVVGERPHGDITDYTYARPATVYHESKLYGERLVEMAGNDLTGAILRLAPPIGPGMAKDKILSAFIINALQGVPLYVYGRGSRKQNYLDISDVAQAVENCIDVHADGHFNIAGNELISNVNLARKVIRVLKSDSKIEFIEQSNSQDNHVFDISITRAINTLKFKPTDLDISIQEIADSLRG